MRVTQEELETIFDKIENAYVNFKMDQRVTPDGICITDLQFSTGELVGLLYELQEMMRK